MGMTGLIEVSAGESELLPGKHTVVKPSSFHPFPQPLLTLLIDFQGRIIMTKDSVMLPASGHVSHCQ